MMAADSLVILATSTLAGLALLSMVFAWSWKAWLDLQRHQLDRDISGPRGDMPVVANRIDLADLRERIKKLEAIAAGVDF